MITRSQKIRLGIFSVIAVSILTISVVIISFGELFEEKDNYFVAYEDISVSGLDVGSSVKYLGLKVGTIKSITIDPKNINKVILEVALNLGTPIKQDVRAEIASVGITGLKLIEIRGGTNESKLLKPGNYITSGKSFTEDITGKAEVIAEKIELVLNNLIELTEGTNREKFLTLIDNTTSAVNVFNNLMTENRAELKTTVTNINEMSKELKLITNNTLETIETINSVFQSDTLREAISNVSRFSKKLERSNVYNLIDNLNASVLRINKILVQGEDIIGQNRENLFRSIQEFKEMSIHLRNTAKMIEDNPSMLIRTTKPEDPPDDILDN